MSFSIVGAVQNVETIAVGFSIRERKSLIERHGKGRWRKLKGMATIRLADGTIAEVELHWYEAHGIGRRDIKIKRRFR